MKHAQLKRDLLVVGVGMFFIVAALLLLRKHDNGIESPVQRQHPFANRRGALQASHEIQIPHGNNTMLVNGEASPVIEQSGIGVSTLESVDDIEENPLFTSAFLQVIRDQKRDFFGPWQFFGPEEAPTHFVFLRYHRLGNDNDGAFTVQAGEARFQEIFWDPPHLFEGFPRCYLLSWKPGGELLYRCLGNTREMQKDNSRREWKYEYHFTIPTEDTEAYVFSRSCRPDEMTGTCDAYSEEVRGPFADACADPLRNVYSADDLSDPVWKKFYRSIIHDTKREQLIEACRSSIDGRERIAFLSSYPRKDAVTMVRVGEYDVQKGRITSMKTHEEYEPFCEINEFIPGVLVRYSCTNPTVAITAALIPVTEYQWDMNLDYHTVRTCRGTRLFVGDTTPQCTPRKPL